LVLLQEYITMHGPLNVKWESLVYKLELCGPNKNFHYFYSPQRTIFFILPT